MSITAVCVQNEALINVDYSFQVQLKNESDNTAYTPTSATVKFLKQDGTVIKDTSAMTTGTGIVSYTLTSTYIDEVSLYNSAVVTHVKNSVTIVNTFIFHVLKQLLFNPVTELSLTSQYNYLTKHKPTGGYFTKIAKAFDTVKDDLVDLYGIQYAYGMIDSSQVATLVELKTMQMIAEDFSIGNSADESNWWYSIKESKEKEYGSKLQKIRIVYDSTVEENTVDLQRQPQISCYR